MRRSETGIGEFQPPRDDLNAPDLYIPSAPSPYVTSLLTRSLVSLLVMAFVTYILLAALQSGLQSRFHPEIFGVFATKAIVVLILDFLFVKGGCYLLGIQGSNPTVDLLAYGGYKFVGYVVGVASSSIKLTTLCRVIGTLLVGLVGFSRTLYTIAFVYTFLANAFFLVRTLCTFPLRSDISLLASITALCRSSRCWCNTRGCWHRLSCTTFPAYHVSLSCRCRADRIHGCIGPCITHGTSYFNVFPYN